MSSVSTEADDTEIAKLPETETETPPLKKQKTDSQAEGDTEMTNLGDSTELETVPDESKAEAEVEPKIRIRRRGVYKEPEFMRQIEIFREQYTKSEGYDVDWDNLDFYFETVKLEDVPSDVPSLDVNLKNKELIELLIKTAIDEENDENETNLVFDKYVSANVEGVKGFLFYITFWAKDLNSPNQEAKLYQAKVRKFGDEILVREFRLRPTQDLLY